MKLIWDKRKARANFAKHGVTFEEAGTIFDDPMSLTFDDPDHSVGECRFLTFGRSRMDRLLVVAHTETSVVIRIISARTVARTERKIYEEG